MPRNSAAHGERTPLVIAHRGASGHRPEHSASAYRLACELGADAVEPDIVVSRDGVLLVRHENELSGTTDIADRPEFASRHTTKVIDGVRYSGWFTEDFTWAELRTLRCRERLEHLRPGSAAYNDREPILRLSEVLTLIDAVAADPSWARADPPTVVIEIKHASYFAAIGFDIAQLLAAELEACGWSQRSTQVVIEAFELGVLARVLDLGVPGQRIFLLESVGRPADDSAHDYAWYRSDAGLDALRGRCDGISVAKSDLLQLEAGGTVVGANDLVDRAHARGLRVYTWTLRPENEFLHPHFRRGAAGAPWDADAHAVPAAEWGDWRGEFGLIRSSGVDGVFLDHPELAAVLTATAHR